MTFTYPHTIDNGAGEQLTFTGRAMGPKGERVEGHNLVAPGAGPPMHVHHAQEEGFTVLEGRIGYQRQGEEPQYAGPGESIVFPAGVPHRFWNAGDSDLRCAGYVSPPGNVEYFLKAMFESQKANGGRMPGLLDIAFLARRYRGEYAMLEVPQAVQKLLFPAVALLGRATGRYAKYADAPEPLDA